MNHNDYQELHQLERNTDMRARTLMHNIKMILENKKKEKPLISLKRKKSIVEPKGW